MSGFGRCQSLVERLGATCLLLVLLLSRRALFVLGQTPATPVIVSDLSGYPGKGYSLGVSLGTPPQELRVIIDTGSSNFAIAGVSNPDIANFFNTSLSSSFIDLNQQVSVTYTEGFWKGRLGTEYLMVAALSPLRVHLVAIDSAKDFYVKDSGWQGILGLAYPTLAKPDSSVTPVFNSLVSSGRVTSNMFSMQLCGTVDKGRKLDITTGGKLVMDGLSSTLYTGNIFYTPVQRTDYYEVAINRVDVDGVPLNFECTEYNNPRTIVDSGTTGLRFPTAVFNEMVKKMRAVSEQRAPTAIKPCAESDVFWQNTGVCCVPPENSNELFSTFPNISIILPVAGSQSTFKLTITAQLYLQAVPAVKLNKDCYKFFILPSDYGSVLGAVAMEGYYVIFDRQHRQIGFAASTCQIRDPEFDKPAVLGPYAGSSDPSACLYVPASSSSDTKYIGIGVGVGVGFIVLMVIVGAVVSNRGSDGRTSHESAGSSDGVYSRFA